MPEWWKPIASWIQSCHAWMVIYSAYSCVWLWVRKKWTHAKGIIIAQLRWYREYGLLLSCPLKVLILLALISLRDPYLSPFALVMFHVLKIDLDLDCRLWLYLDSLLVFYYFIACFLSCSYGEIYWVYWLERWLYVWHINWPVTNVRTIHVVLLHWNSSTIFPWIL
jgi:hypothetical protein